jgi:hypothetical protein
MLLSDILGPMRHRILLATTFFLPSLFFTSNAAAQGYPPPAPQPAPTQAPPPGYPPPAYAPPQAPAAAPPPAYPPTTEAPPGWSTPGYSNQYRYQPMPMELRYVEGRPIPPGYHAETRPRKGLVISGSIVFGIPYFLSLSVAASSKFTPDRWLYAPIVGPFVDLGNRKEDCTTIGNAPFGSTTTCKDDSSERFFLMADGLMQVAGATMLILGLALPQHLLVRDDAPFVGSKRSQFAWSVAPQKMGRSGYGLGLAGTF